MAVRLERGEIWLDVDDRGVVWPVTIDPTFTLQQKLVASDGFAQAFGWSVAISGDTVVVGTHGGRRGPRSRLGLCLCAQRWHLDRAAEGVGVGRGGR